jgi:hypothetical protein
MLFRVFICAAALVAVMALVKDGRVMRDAGLFGSCSVVKTPKGEPTSWRACRDGKVSGSPDLSRQSCKRWGTMNDRVYWRCAATVSAAYTP